jgi:hypothetical protein
MPHKGELRWRKIIDRDFPEIDRIAKIIHPDLPERIETLAEKIELSPSTCLVVCDGAHIRGYAIAYPWRMNDMPPLDTMLGAIPEDACILYIHDVALLPSVRGQGLVGKVLKNLSDAGRELGLEQFTLAAVYGSEEAWFRYGFRRAPMDEKLMAQSAGYGAAVYMTRDFSPA